MIKKILIKLGSVILVAIISMLLFASVRGVSGNPTSNTINSDYYKDDGPFELSPERGRYALTYSLVEDRSLYFSLPIARFVTPDLGYINGNYVSLFAPTVSLLVIPGYILGSIFGLAQVGTFLVVSFFALLNFVLVRRLSLRLGAKSSASTVAGLTFLFATPGYAYAVNLYQHHISTFIILLTALLVVSENLNWKRVGLIFFLSALSVTIDYPNFFMMLPLGLYTLYKIIPVKSLKDKFVVHIDPRYLFSVIGLLVPMVMFGAFNLYTYGSPLTLSGTVPSVDAIDDQGKPYQIDADSADISEKVLIEQDAEAHSFISYFEPRDMVRGIYIHIFSPDRGVIVYTPVILFGIIGALVLYRSKNKYLALLLSIMLTNLILYSMWGDPWGGWAFGSRYLIPGYAIMSVFIALALSRFSKNLFFLLLYFVILVYSVGVSTLGAITTSTNPPKVQALPLEALTGKRERYSYDRNWEYLTSTGSKSYVFQKYAFSYMEPKSYYVLLTSIISVLSLGVLVFNYLEKGGRYGYKN